MLLRRGQTNQWMRAVEVGVNGCLCKLRVLVVGVLDTTSRLFQVHIRAPDFWKLPELWGPKRSPRPGCGSSLQSNLNGCLSDGLYKRAIGLYVTSFDHGSHVVVWCCDIVPAVTETDLLILRLPSAGPSQQEPQRFTPIWEFQKIRDPNTEPYFLVLLF